MALLLMLLAFGSVVLLYVAVLPALKRYIDSDADLSIQKDRDSYEAEKARELREGLEEVDTSETSSVEDEPTKQDVEK
jgi:hypothetical protein